RRAERGDEGATRRGDLLRRLAADPNAEGAPERPEAEQREHDGAGHAERDAQRVDLEQPARAGDAERRVDHVDDRRARADRDADPEAAAQRRAQAEEPDRPDLRRRDEAEPEPSGERGRHYPVQRSGSTGSRTPRPINVNPQAQVRPT